MAILRSGLIFALTLLVTRTSHAFMVAERNRFSVGHVPLPDSRAQESKTCRFMVVIPVGPFCPFRSSAAMDMDPRMERLNSATPEFATEMARIQLDMQTGQAPDPQRLRTVADGIEAAVEDWENLLTRLRLSSDFQTREYAKLTQAHLASHDQTSQEISIMMRWQAQCMRALAENNPPPMPPPGVDMMKMMQEAQAKSEAGGGQPPSLTAMANAEKITSTPFTGKEAAFESPTVKEEYKAICRDHQALVSLGSDYASYDPLGKIRYLDEIEKIEERWDVFFARFSLMGALNQDFIRQCNAFLDSMGLNESDFRKLLKKTHAIMREDAEKERNGLPC
mmetsp:Transcript_22453/g.40504  ORF Transcript_22453/g.40504 Transcript_22453/m.40504 type:complete len:336 (-) Transcript_22453:425-1432(-)|eukprot:CAMPEP_0198289150 /NCGR_PEP_ID=MMETSP1449-20131203/7451_1 /TAXON_ID=420275 /ORGANISM="Attheya septentrionalis, Strain CCMP2084" /LENGTH=335 /DNA_ID=CAMNT_0043987445 /DNA_START=64 /DNA_END=1071 /DNA_ORIENTATION=-